MITKILPPTNNREINYDNKGSCERLVQYFEHEARDANEESLYFDQWRNDLSKEEVVFMIDHNVKGLKKDDTKFVSLVIAPSKEELQHIGNSQEKLQEYTRKVMENYASNFKLKNDKQVPREDLVWYGIVHKNRKYQWDEQAVKEGRAERGERKEGDQMHIHIVVSTRDRDQSITLNPKTSKQRFNIIEFQKKNGESFQHLFSYTKQTQYHQEKKSRDRSVIDQARYFENRINRLADRLLLDESTVRQIRQKAVETGYSKEFYGVLKTYTKRIEAGEGRREDLTEFRKLKPAELALDRGSVQQTDGYSLQRNYALESIFRGASISKDDDREISTDLSNKRGLSI